MIADEFRHKTNEDPMTEEQLKAVEDALGPDDAVMSELRAAAATAGAVRPSVHTLLQQHAERGKYEAERQQALTQPTRELVTATRMREALTALLTKTNAAATHAAAIAAQLDGGPNNVVAPLQAGIDSNGAKRPLFAQFAKQVVDISQAVDLIEAQLKRIDGVLS